MTSLRAAVVGLGVMGSFHLRVLRAIADVDVVAGVDPDPERRAAAARAHPDVPVVAAIADALERRPDVAAIAVPVTQLPVVARHAVDAGVAALVEKPLAPTEEEAIALVRHAEARGVPLGVGHVERFNPAVRALAGRTGRILQVRARRLGPPPARPGMPGVALDLATHDLDVMRAVTAGEIARLRATSGGEAGDRVSATLRFDDGATGRLEAGWVTGAKVRELTVAAERGTFVVDYLAQELWNGGAVRVPVERREPLRVEWEEFLAAIRTGAPPPVGGWDGVAALSCARAIDRSAAEGRAVRPGYRDVLALAGSDTPPAAASTAA